MRVRRQLAVAGLGAAMVAALLPTSAGAINLVVVSVSTTQGYVLPATPLAQGMGLDYTNIDALALHNVVSDDTVAGSPLFTSGAPMPAGQTRNVAGVEALTPGTYGFSCVIHSNMRGLLVVLPVGDPTGSEPPTPEPPAVPPVRTPGMFGGVSTPTAITSRGGALYAASFAQNSVYQMPILSNGLLGVATAYATGFNAPLGIAFGDDGTLYVADSHASNRGRASDGRVWRIPAGGGSASTVGEVVVDGLPNGRHNTNNLAIHNGRLFITNGNSTDDGVAGGDPEEPLSGTLLSVPLSATGLTITSPTDPLPAGLEIEARGMRNIYDVAFRPGTDEAWIPMNGPDAFDPFGEDLMLVADTAGPTPDFGFPDCLYAPAGTAGGTDNGSFSIKENPVTPGLCDAGGSHALPERLLGLHTSANGLAFNPAGTDLYVALFGNFFGDQVVGHKVVKLAIDANGKAGPPQDVISPSLAPLDIAWVAPYGFYVADFATGQITLIRT